MRGATFALALLALIGPGYASSQELVPDRVVTMKARVLEIVSVDEQIIPGTKVNATYQTIRAEILDGPERGQVVTVEDDFLELKKGQKFFMTHTTSSLDGTDYYTVNEPYRLPALGILTALFIATVLIFGGKQGLRGLLSLAASLLLIVFVLLPGVMQGYPPILVAVGVASLIIVAGSYVTHGFTWTTSTAVLGMIVTVIFTGVLAYIAVPLTGLTGFATDESIYLNLNTQGALDLSGLLIAGILIGTLGVLYDAAIGQAVSVEELSAAGKHLSRGHIFRRALRIGREHIGALVNTLAIAYVGASLPLLLLFYGFGDTSILVDLNREIFATEIVRTLIGSIGLILAVPITTLISVHVLVGRGDVARTAVDGHRHS